MKKDPLFISGLGGSGTRVVVAILKELKFNFGYDVNRSDDDLSFTLLFKLPKHFYEYFNKKSSYVQQLLKVHYKLRNNVKFEIAENILMLKIVILQLFQFRRYNVFWIISRFISIIKNRKEPKGIWGWKEPHCIMFIDDIYLKYPNSKFILLIRNGLDMAFSKNKQQFENYYKYFDIDKNDNSPSNRFEFWYRLNKYAIEKGNSLFKNNFIILFYEDLVDMDSKSITAIENIVGKSISEESISKLKVRIKDPGTINRFKRHSTDWINNEVLHKLKEIGYDPKSIIF